MVTGAGQGMGLAIATALYREGARVLVLDVNEETAAGAAKRLDPEGVRAIGRRGDVTRAEDVKAAVRALQTAWGGVDILVNNAGGALRTPHLLHEIQDKDWNLVVDVNLKGTFLCCQAVIGPMRRQRYGRIVNLGSVVGKNAGNARPWLAPQEQEVASNAAYGASKAGVHAITGFLAKELAPHGITVNAVAPGPIATAMTTAFPEALRQLIPVGRMGNLDDVVRAILFLGSRDGGFVNGEVLDVNGGMWCD
jgi:NAD(P)-dependent dehydrogenase (short-subunit alcohol dehydrogenase family)